MNDRQKLYFKNVLIITVENKKYTYIKIKIIISKLTNLLEN
jgi:hypothetical protein